MENGPKELFSMLVKRSPGVPEVIYNPVAIYGMMIFWIYLNFGMASDIQYIKDNHAQMHVLFRNSNNERRLDFKVFYLV